MSGLLGRSRFAVLLAATGLSLAVAPPPVAATPLGSTFAPVNGCGSNATFIQSSTPDGNYAVPFGGVISLWSFQAGASAPSPLKLKAARLVAGNDFTIIGESAPETPSASALNTYPTRISVQAGDVIGFYIGVGGQCVRGLAGFKMHSRSGDYAPGTTVTFNGPFVFQLDISAILEPDVDNDGFGDETQDACPTDGTTQQAPCPVPETTITNQPKKKTKKKTARFEFSSSLPGASFECKLDDGQFLACTSPDTIKVGKGKRHFEVRASARGQIDASPATYDWKVKKKKKKK
jgi:hypothetical protein